MIEKSSELHQEKLINSHQWDILFIFDACRYDYFKLVYSKFFYALDLNFTGSLKKVISPASGTLEWCSNVFTKSNYKDIIYVSSNPFVNSKGYSTRSQKGNILSFYPKDRFYQVIDVWDFGWNNQLNTVPPNEVNKVLLEIIKKYPNKRFIIHYLQPHAPYLYFIKLGFRQYSGFERKNRVEKFPFKKILGRMLTKLGEVPYIPKYCVLKARLFLGLEFNPLHFTWLTLGNKGLQFAYIKNLECVFNSLFTILINIKELRGKKMVITSDHGELLGEDNLYGHFSGSEHPALREVPWFEFIVNNN